MRAHKAIANMFKLKPGISKVSRGCVFHNNEAFVYSIDAYFKSDLHLHEQVGMSLIQSRTANAITIDRDRTKSCFAVGGCSARDRQTETATEPIRVYKRGGDHPHDPRHEYVQTGRSLFRNNQVPLRPA